ncbi:MAG: hypothetical protein FJ138_17770 [Deltaproteobacteria bacterium]|nr:hypothetical protein [Deltaproteobacteria bacterium]
MDLGTQPPVDGLQHIRLDGTCGGALSPVSITTSLSNLAGATRLVFYARAAEGVSPADSNLRVRWGSADVMDEPLLDQWAEYEVDLTRPGLSREDVVLSLSPSLPGALVDGVRVY